MNRKFTFWSLRQPAPSVRPLHHSALRIFLALAATALTTLAQTPPSILTQPTNQTVLAGGDALLQVAVSGTGPFTYQWQCNGTNLPNDWIITVAGNGTASYSGDGAAGTKAGLNAPFGVAADAAGNVYVGDYYNSRVRKIDPSGIITTVAGNGQGGYSGDGGAAINASLSGPAGLLMDATGNLFFADYYNNRIRKVDPNGIITTVAGDGNGTFAGDGGPAEAASLHYPFGLTFDTAGNLYIADAGNGRIRKVDTNAIITTVAGGGYERIEGGWATNAGLGYPTGVAVDALGNLLIADNGGNAVRKVDTNGIITTFAGTGSYITSGDGGPAVNAGISYPRGLALDSAGNLFICAFYDNRIRKVDTNGIITTVAGNGDSAYGSDNQSALTASFYYPQGVAVGPRGNLFVADHLNYRVREVTVPGPTFRLTNVSTNNTANYSVIVSNASGSVTSSVAALTVVLPPSLTQQPQNQVVLVGNRATFSVAAGGTPPFAYQWQFNDAPIPDATNASYSLRAVTTNDAGGFRVVVSSPFGSATSSVAVLTVVLPPSLTLQPAEQRVVDGASAVLSVGVTGPGPYTYQWRLNGTNLPNGLIQTVAGKGGSGTYSGDGGAATNAYLNDPNGVAMDATGNLFIADRLNHRVRKVAANGTIVTVAGKGSVGFSGDGGKATNATLYMPASVALDRAGNLFIADASNHRIRKVDPSGIITTVAGTGAAAFSGDGGPASSAAINYPGGLAVDAAGNLFITDSYNYRIRKVDTNGIITTVAGNGSNTVSGNGGPATNAGLPRPYCVALDTVGNLFIAEGDNHVVRKVDTNGIITTVAGTGTGTFSGDGGPATNAALRGPSGLAVHPDGHLFIADAGNNRIRRVDTNGIITTVAGKGTGGYAGDGGPATNATVYLPAGLAMLGPDQLLIADRANHRIRKVLLQGPMLPLNPVLLNNIGNYDVVVANLYGSVTSSVARITLALPPLQATRGADQSLQFQFSGKPGTAYTLQAATSLVPPVAWQPVTTNLSDSSGLWRATHPNVPAAPALFYRAVMP